MNVDALVERVRRGEQIAFLFFWGHTPRWAGAVDDSCLSQWFPVDFTVGGVRYASAEHYMMAEKARLFADTAQLERILAAPGPREAKKLGRRVSPFDEQRWSQRRLEAVVEGNLAKFGEDARLREFLLGTGDRVLVEASPHDAIWGVGLEATDPRIQDPRQWRGQNLLGFALGEVRRRLATT